MSGEDVIALRRARIDESAVRRVQVAAIVDTASSMLGINEAIRGMLGLPTIEQTTVRLADGTRIVVDVVGPVEVRFANRRANVDALVLPGDGDVLLGCVPLECLDVLVDPLRQRLIPNPAHPDAPVVQMPSVVREVSPGYGLGLSTLS